MFDHVWLISRTWSEGGARCMTHRRMSMRSGPSKGRSVTQRSECCKKWGQRTNEQMMLGCSSTQMWLDNGYMMRIQGGYNIEMFHVGVFEMGYSPRRMPFQWNMMKQQNFVLTGYLGSSLAILAMRSCKQIPEMTVEHVFWKPSTRQPLQPTWSLMNSQWQFQSPVVLSSWRFGTDEPHRVATGHAGWAAC